MNNSVITVGIVLFIIGLFMSWVLFIAGIVLICIGYLMNRTQMPSEALLTIDLDERIKRNKPCHPHGLANCPYCYPKEPKEP